jgi:hypothetical protein
MTTYGRASKAAWFEDKYLGSIIDPNAGVLHTTEGTSLPSYSGGATAPNYTAVPDFRRKRLKWYAHFSDERSSRALRNNAGGVETNTLHVVQVELVGTCDPGTSAAWTKAGRKHIFWPGAPDWALRDLALFIADMNRRHGIKISGPASWRAYPSSYGETNPNRFTFAQWRSFYGWCGHQHVPENSHGDPGNLPWAAVERLARGMQVGAEPIPSPPKRSPRWDALWERADELQDSLPPKANGRRKALAAVKRQAAKYSVRYPRRK